MSGEIRLDFEQLPALAPSYFRAVANFGSGLAKGDTIPAIVARLNDLEVRAENLARYRKVCGFPRAETLPLTYPHALAFPMHMAVLTHKRFPLKLLGLIHVRNHITQHRAIRVDEPLDLIVSVGGHRDVAKGVEFDLTTQVKDAAGDTIWEETGVMLSRGKSGGSGGASGQSKQPPELGFTPDEEATWQVPADIGRRYAAAAGDYNPIHLSPWSARLFGFPRAIATGMWVKARAAAALQPHVAREAYSLSVAFKKPVFLPSTVLFKEAGGDNGLHFALTSRAGDTHHLTGEVRYISNGGSDRSRAVDGRPDAATNDSDQLGKG
ncbi:MaoC family dehydratase [Salinisphaera sp.]|uniref:MaoC family dehydratase n=1 Tax=Salinisphaera sp. TaxID=1914330 RepID=UPI002D789AC0|nr:MaoC/PaaZ C-terminal domain-containing protein [Salinisphaera sp.]HET7314318.1 MaoC/PaaZ C-terminal domain-containing protein [Salinisphaera sp.]